MQRIAALYTCFNRKEKTLASLATLQKASTSFGNSLQLDVFLTDDGSTDGTSEAVSKHFSYVTIIKGDGSLFWAEGMRSSWKEALKNNYDAFLLLNDDVELYEDFFSHLFQTHEYSINTYNKGGVYIGATENKNIGKLTYSGSLVLSKILYTQNRLAPNGDFQICDLANANIMLVHNTVVDAIGILSKGYSHGMADYDYTLTARRKKIPVLVAPEYCGHCVNDHKSKYENFEKLSFSERKKILYSPTGLAFKSYKKYMWKFFPMRYPAIVFFGYFKLYFPTLYKVLLDRK
jgi:GT2 family glycosyltransferase